MSIFACQYGHCQIGRFPNWQAHLRLSKVCKSINLTAPFSKFCLMILMYGSDKKKEFGISEKAKCRTNANLKAHWPFFLARIKRGSLANACLILKTKRSKIRASGDSNPCDSKQRRTNFKKKVSHVKMATLLRWLNLIRKRKTYKRQVQDELKAGNILGIWPPLPNIWRIRKQSRSSYIDEVLQTTITSQQPALKERVISDDSLQDKWEKTTKQNSSFLSGKLKYISYLIPSTFRVRPSIF